MEISKREGFFIGWHWVSKMKYFYSFSSSGFYSDYHNNIPADAIQLKKGDYEKLLAGLEYSKQIISVDGYPTLVDMPPVTDLEISNGELSARITKADQQIAIIKPAVDGGYAKPEHTILLGDWQRYRYELMLVPEQSDWPVNVIWPEEPQ